MARLTSIDSTTRFSEVYIAVHSTPPRMNAITAFTADGNDNVQVYFPNTGDVIDSGQLAILTVLREHYVEHGGFIDSDGNIVPIHIDGWIYGDTPESFAEFGFWNPLDADGWANYEQGLKTAGDYSKGESIRTVSDSGLITQQVQGVQPMKRKSDEANTGVSLERFEAFQSGTKIVFSLTIPLEEQVEPDDLDEYAEVKAFLAWLRTKQPLVQTDFGTDASADASFENKTITVRQIDGDSTSDVVLSFDDLSTVASPIGGTHYVYLWRVFFTRSSGAEIDPDALSGYFEDVRINIETGEEVTQEPTFGSTEVRTRTKGLIFPDGAGITYESGKIWKKIINPNRNIVHVPIQQGAGESIHYFNLVSAPGNSKYVPDFTSPYDTLHFGTTETTFGVIKFREANFHVRSPETDMLWTIHNRSASHHLDMFVEGSLLAVLYPSEVATVRITLHRNGDGEFVVQSIPTRRYVNHHSDSNVGFGNRPYFSQGTRNYTLYQTNDTPQHHSLDTFSNTTTTRNPQGANIDTYANFDFKEGITMKQNGSARILAGVDLRNQATDGAIGAWNGIRIWCKRGTLNPLVVGGNSLPGIGPSEERSYTLAALWDARVDDFIFATHRYSGSPDSFIQIIETRMEIEMDPNLLILRTAS